MNSISLKLLRSSSSLFSLSKFTRASRTHLLINRLLFTPQALKIDNMKHTRETFKSASDLDDFRSTIIKKCEGGIEYLILVDDIKQMIRLCESDDDLELFIRMLKKYSMQGSMIKFGKDVIGPEIMRLFHILNVPEKALEIIKDPKTNKLFNDISSWVILGDLLFKNEMYQEVIDLLYLFKSMQRKLEKYTLNFVTLFFASCYKLNSRKSYEEASEMMESLEKFGYKIPRRILWLYSVLALRQKEANEALKFANYIKFCGIAKNIKVLALLEEKKFSELFNLLDKIIIESEHVQKDNSNSKEIGTTLITVDTLQHLEKSLEEAQSSTENFNKFQKIKQQLLAHNIVSNKSLEDHILHPIEDFLLRKKQ